MYGDEGAVATDGTRVEIGHELIRYGRMLHMLKAELADILPKGLDPAAGQLLSWLVRQGPSRQGELADSTFLDASTVSRRISQLVTLGLVERRADPGDGRAVQLVPTATGTELFRRLAETRDQLVQRTIGDWPEHEVAEFGRLLHKFNDGLEASRLQPRE